MKTGIFAALAIALVALYFVFGTDMLAPAKSDKIKAQSNPSAGATEPGEPAATPVAREVEPSERPKGATDKQPDGDDAATDPLAAAPGSGPGVTRTPGTPTTYTRHDGTVVRDHRVDAPKPDLHAYTVLPPEASKVKPNTIIAVRQAIRAPMKKCIEAHGQDAADDGKIQLLLLTSIASEKLTIDKAVSKISGLAAEADLGRCVEEAVVGHQQPVEGAEDVNIHRMVFKYDL